MHLRSLALLLLAVACRPEDTTKPDPADDTAPTDDTAPDDTDPDDTADDTATDDTGPLDADGDGAAADVDCDDADPTVFPGAEERCNAVDDDCDGVVPDAETLDGDADGDVYCLDCDDRDAKMLASDGTCAAYEFPLGYMSAEDTAEFPTLAALGIRWVHSYNFGAWPGNDVATDIAWSTDYLDAAQASGLSVLANLHGRTRAEVGADVGTFTTFVDAIAEHPALGAWYLADEPEFTVTQDALFEMDAALRSARPDLPVQVAHCWCTDWWSFWDVGDVTMPDYYGIYADDGLTANSLYHPIFTSYHRTYYTEMRVEPVMQGFSYAVFSGDDPVTYPPESRFPLAEELRFWAFADLTLGVKGLWWWSWYRAGQLPEGAAWKTDTFAPALTEIKAFTDAVLPAENPVRVNPGPYDIVDYTYLAYWPRPAGTYVVAANGRTTTATLDLPLGADFAGRTLTPWDTTTPTVTLDATGAGTVDAAPMQVLVWVVE